MEIGDRFCRPCRVVVDLGDGLIFVANVVADRRAVPWKKGSEPLLIIMLKKNNGL